ncbi:hypothetical protein [Dyella nitratireducens]|nr:hypothetical protein [Dyella nitratireducens]
MFDSSIEITRAGALFFRHGPGAKQLAIALEAKDKYRIQYQAES